MWSKGDPTLAWRDTDPQTTDDATTLCSTQFGNGPGGDIAYVGPCDAGNNADGPGGDSQQTNSILLWVDGLYDTADPPAPLAASGNGWRNPCPYDPMKPLDGACLLEATCIENRDVGVVINLTIMRDAKQGFFDVGVNFEDIFCSAKVDCSRLTGNGEEPILLLHSPLTDTRVPTVVVGLACTGGALADTYLYLSAYLDCSAAPTPSVVPLALGGPAGNVYSAASPAPLPLLQLATYRGLESLTNPDGAALNKIYFNTALALDFANLPGACNLVGTFTASDGAFPSPFTTPANTIYPIITVDVPLVGGANATEYACGRHPLGTTPGDFVWTVYTPADAGTLLDYRAHKVAGAVEVESRGDITGDLFTVLAGIRALSEHFTLVTALGQPSPFAITGQSSNYTLQGGILSLLTEDP